MAKRRRRVTAEEFTNQLLADPGYVARLAKRDHDLSQIWEQDDRAEEPLVKSLRAGGAEIESVWDLVNTRERYPKLIPILLTHLKRESHPKVLEGIARALAVPEARVGWTQLVSRFCEEPTPPEDGTNHVKSMLARTAPWIDAATAPITA